MCCQGIHGARCLEHWMRGNGCQGSSISRQWLEYQVNNTWVLGKCLGIKALSLSVEIVRGGGEDICPLFIKSWSFNPPTPSNGPLIL